MDLNTSGYILSIHPEVLLACSINNMWPRYILIA